MVPNIQFHFVGAEALTDIPVHGAIGGISPNGEGLFFIFYSERSAIPTLTVHPSDGNSLEPEDLTQRQINDGIVRSMKVCTHFSLTQAESFRDLLQTKIDEYKALMGTGAPRQ